jgi:hypothetical protein
LHRRFSDRASFLFVYIQEAHPSDGWQVKSNEEEDVVFADPKTWNERRQRAAECVNRLGITMPCAVDTIDNKVDELYAGWPERIFVVDRHDTIAYAGGQGPFGFKPKEAERALRRLLR